ncbi:MAG: membrane protein [Fimbriimonadales bacterium]|nr:MAG: membrane protein [Fimbriimonadales bacterium]
MGHRLLEFFDRFRTSTPSALLNAVDILVVAYLAYRLLLLVRGGRAWRILLGVTAYLVVWFVSGLVGLQTLHFLLDKGLLLGPVALVILFLPELRAALEGFGGLGAWTEKLAGRGVDTTERTIKAIVAAAKSLSKDSVGALIVIERQKQLDEIVRTGIALDARVSAPLLCSLFYGQNPLHDGAVVIRGDRVVAASCRLPSTDRVIGSHMHMRHRAGIGVTEETDAIALIVSEERGTISLAWGGRIRENITPERLQALLTRMLAPPEPKTEKSKRAPRGRKEARAEEAKQ